MPTLEWIGKDKVVNHHLDVPYRVLERQYSYDENGQHEEDNGSENMIIHGDNLDALKSLLPQYEGRVKCIYIDPPYNTGNEKWVYNDNVNDPRIREWLGKTVGAEGEDLSRHDKWLCMMYPRLKLLQRLLTDDGVIFISIDDNELYNLKAICDEIFGLNCFVSKIAWQNNYSLRNDAKGIPYETDNILVYSKKPGWNPRRLARTKEMDARYVNYDNDTTSYKVTPIHAPGAGTHKSMVYAVQHPITGELMYPPQGRHWKDGQDKLLEIMRQWAPYELRIIEDSDTRQRICGSDVPVDIPAIMLSVPLEQAKEIATKRYNTKPWPSYFFLSNGLGSIQAKTYLDPTKGKVVSTLWKYDEVGTNVEATNELKPLMDGTPQFDTPKPTRLLERIVQIATDGDSIVLDSFAGSATTAHAVLNLNKADGGNRKYILIEMMDYAEDITAERVKRVISGYTSSDDVEETVYDVEITTSNLADGAVLLADAKRAANEAKQLYDKVSKLKVVNSHLRVIGTFKSSEEIEGTGGSFSYYELGEPLMIGNVLNEEVGVDKIREYVYFTDTKSRLPEPHPDEPYYMGVHVNSAYYFYYERETITTLNRAFLHTIKTKADAYVIYADLCMFSDAELEKYHITFKKIPRDITRL